MRTTDILSSRKIPYNEIAKVPTYKKDGKRIPHPYIRCSNQGELINDFHYINIIQICRKNPTTTFVLYTKRKDIVYRYGKKDIAKDHPLCDNFNEVKNLILIFSQPKINSIPDEIPKHFDKVFSVYSNQFISKNRLSLLIELNYKQKVYIRN